ncbi:hypothetical protein [Methylobacterium sp. AMS5]|uniref:hypothetical protein n=1 Tax=Methylobacterium sp. AMS5 TaxID=925818 RepID=UPI00074F9B36|nr:hypothetical protein [Methylobacterium sp. AMS5]AMB48435.1 hypothetical protein Y590_26030 [Methylobacterium sp. AMS5]
MGRLIRFPTRLTTPCPRPATAASVPPLVITEDAPGTAAEEFAAGFNEGTALARYNLAQTELLALAAADGPTAFLRQLKLCAFVQENRAAASAPLGTFSAFMYGRLGGGVGGAYARGHRAAILMAAGFAGGLH